RHGQCTTGETSKLSGRNHLRRAGERGEWHAAPPMISAGQSTYPVGIVRKVDFHGQLALSDRLPAGIAPGVVRLAAAGRSIKRHSCPQSPMLRLGRKTTVPA